MIGGLLVVEAGWRWDGQDNEDPGAGGAPSEAVLTPTCCGREPSECSLDNRHYRGCIDESVRGGSRIVGTHLSQVESALGSNLAPAGV